MKRAARKLKEVADDCEEEAGNMEPALCAQSNKDEASSNFTPRADDPWIIARRTADDRLRTFVADLSIATSLLFRKELYNTIANIANVVFSRNDVTGQKVRETLRRGQ